jgi:hypothetical protein
MDVFRLGCEAVNISAPSRSAIVPQLLVDTGSELTWLLESVLYQIGVTIIKKVLAFRMANGQAITRPTGYAVPRASGFETVDEVVFGQPGDPAILGARTLEGFGATVDSSNRRLVATGPHPATEVVIRLRFQPPSNNGSTRLWLPIIGAA